MPFISDDGDNVAFSMPAGKQLIFNANSPDCGACKRSITEHAKEGKCLFGPGEFIDVRHAVFRIHSGPQLGGGEWTLEFMHGGKLVFTDTDGSKKTAQIRKLFDLIKDD